MRGNHEPAKELRAPTMRARHSNLKRYICLLDTCDTATENGRTWQFALPKNVNQHAFGNMRLMRLQFLALIGVCLIETILNIFLEHRYRRKQIGTVK